MSAEFSHEVRLDEIGAGLERRIAANDIECAALARRLGLVAVNHLAGTLTLRHEDEGVHVQGTVAASVVAACAVSGADVPQRIEEAINVLAVEPARGGGEVELEAEELDRVTMTGGRIDLGEVMADSLALALDPYPRADAETVAAARRFLGTEEAATGGTSAFAALFTKAEDERG